MLDQTMVAPPVLIHIPFFGKLLDGGLYDIDGLYKLLMSIFLTKRFSRRPPR